MRRKEWSEELEKQLSAVASYYNDAAQRLSEILDLVSSDAVNINLPIANIKNIVEKPPLIINFGDIEKLKISKEVKPFLETSNKRYELYSALLEESRSKERAFAMPVDMIRSMRDYLLKSRKQANQAAFFLKVYILLNVPEERNTSKFPVMRSSSERDRERSD